MQMEKALWAPCWPVVWSSSRQWKLYRFPPFPKPARTSNDFEKTGSRLKPPHQTATRFGGDPGRPWWHCF